jgi:hypothetical protein
MSEFTYTQLVEDLAGLLFAPRVTCTALEGSEQT